MITVAPTPEPISAMTACRAPRPAPNHISACPWVFAPFSTYSGAGHAGVAHQVGQRDAVPADGLRVHPDPLALLDRAGHADADAQHVALGETGLAEQLGEPRRDQRGDERGVGLRRLAAARSTAASRVIDRSNSSIATPVSPTSTPTTVP